MHETTVVFERQGRRKYLSAALPFKCFHKWEAIPGIESYIHAYSTDSRSDGA